MMTQGELGFKYEVEHQGGGMSGMGGIGPYLDLACRSGMVRSIERHVKVRGGQGWTDAESVLSLVMQNLVGGDCVEDLDIEWHYKRCGGGEQAHSVMKEDLAGGRLPSGDFGENAAWWWSSSS